MTKQEALSRAISALEDPIVAGEFWYDASYEEDIEALAKLGSTQAKERWAEIVSERKNQ